MTTSVEIVGSVVDVYRRCQVCAKVKPLEHYLLYSGNYAGGPKSSVHTCAACRARGRKPG